ncbi:MAG: septation protein SpoVG family protein [bacterium]
MKITYIQIRKIDNGKILAFVRIVFDNEFIIKNAKLVKDSNGLYV